MIQLLSTYLGNKSWMALAVAGAISLGLTMAQFPAAMAGVRGARLKQMYNKYQLSTPGAFSLARTELCSPPFGANFTRAPNHSDGR